MKKIIKIITLTILTLWSSNSIAQVTVTMSDMTNILTSPVTSINHCGNIDFNLETTVRLQFQVSLTKLSNTIVNAGTIQIYYQKSSTDSKMEVGAPYSIPASPNFNTSFLASFDIELYANNFNISGGTLFAIYQPFGGSENRTTCNYSIIKDETPTFTLSTTPTSINCNSTSPVTFTVNNENNSSGILSYNWVIGSGWNFNGTTAPANLPTTTNTLLLVPTVYPPSNVKVTPVLDGKSYSQLTSTVSLKDYKPSYSISGNNSTCLSSTPEVYSIANLPSDVIVTWSSSNTAIATVNSTTGSSTTVNLLSNGTFNLNARVTNSCGQFKDVPSKWISVGNPEVTGLMHIPTFGCTMGEINVEYNGGAELFEWQVSGGEIVIPNSGTSYIGGGTIFVDPSDNAHDLRVKVRAINSCGYSSWFTKYIPISCDPDGGGGVTPLSIDPETDINNTTIEVYPNPVDTELTILSGNNILSKIQLYNSKGKLVLKKTNPQNIEVINVSKIPNGIYSLLLLGETKTVKKIIVQH